MRRIYTIQALRKELQKCKPFSLSRSVGDNSAKSPRQGLIPLWSFRSMPSFLDIGGSKVRVSSNNSFARLQRNAIFVSRRQASILPHTPRSKLLSQQSQHGARTATLKSG